MLVRETFIHDEMSITSRRDQMRGALASAEFLLSLLSVAYNSQLISNMNYTIVRDELLLMHTHLFGQFESLKDGTTFSARDEEVAKIFGGGQNAGLSPQEEVYLANDPDSEHEEDPIVQEDAIEDLLMFGRKGSVPPGGDRRVAINGDDFFDQPDESFSTPDATPQAEQKKDTVPVLQGDMEDEETLEKVTSHDAALLRKKEIMESLESGENYSISDLIEKMPHYSRRTMQREMNTLVMLGVASKEGDRRWSSYQLLK